MPHYNNSNNRNTRRNRYDDSYNYNRHPGF